MNKNGKGYNGFKALSTVIGRCERLCKSRDILMTRTWDQSAETDACHSVPGEAPLCPKSAPSPGTQFLMLLTQMTILLLFVSNLLFLLLINVFRGESRIKVCDWKSWKVVDFLGSPGWFVPQLNEAFRCFPSHEMTSQNKNHHRPFFCVHGKKNCQRGNVENRKSAALSFIMNRKLFEEISFLHFDFLCGQTKSTR